MVRQTKKTVPARKRKTPSRSLVLRQSKKQITGHPVKKIYSGGEKYRAPTYRRDRPRTSGVGRFFSRLIPQLSFYKPVIIVVVLLAVIGLSFYFYQKKTFADTAETITSQADWEAGEYYTNTVDTATTLGSLQIKSGGVGTWDSSTPAFPEDTRGSYNLATQVPNYGADLTTDGSYIYMIPGNNLPLFWRYNPNTNTWKQLADAPTPFYYNSALAYYNGKIYAINGHDGAVTTDATGEFWEYDIAADTWTRLADAPDAWGASANVGGADIKSGNNGKIYAVQGNGQTGFWAFDTVAGTWSALAPVPDPITNANSHPLSFSSKSFTVSGITYCTSGCLYTFVSARSFYRYDIAGEQWYTSFADVPSALGSVAAGSAITEDSDNHIFYAFRGGNDEFMKYVVGDVAETVAGAWDTASDAGCVSPATCTEDTQQRNVTQGASLVYLKVNGVGYVYGLLGGSQPEFMRYDISVPKWDMVWSLVSSSTNAENLITYVPSGSDCSDSTDGCIFVVPANTSSATVRRFNIQTRTWTASSGVVNTGAGATSCYDGHGTIYVARGANTLNVYNYNISDGSVSSIDLAAGRQAGAGADLSCPGADNTAYLLHGNGGVLFSRLVNTTWTAMQTFTGSTPALPYLNVNYGATLASDGTDMYALIGNGRGVFLKYTVSSNNWSELASLPTNTGTSTQAYTSVINYDGQGNIYAIPGHYQKDMWRYDISENTWSRAADLPVRMARSMGMTKGNNGSTMYVLRGESWYSIYKFNPVNANYIASATWMSAPIDLDYVSSFISFTADETLNGNTISYATRTSTDGVGWSAWASTTNGGAITSSPARYIQIKIQLNSANGTATPVLNSFTVNYHEDVTDPANPTVTAFSDSTETTPLTDTGSYFYTNPYFEFTSTEDGGSPIAGYYAAWTTDSNFDPSDPGYNESYFQAGTTYLVRRPMSRSGAGTVWYMRIATKDQAGNIASPQTKFQYTYTGIASTDQKSWASYAAFTAAGTTLSSVTASQSPDAVKLSAVANGAWTNEAPLPFNAAAGSSIIFVPANHLMYVMQGGSRSIRSYNPSTKVYSAALGTYPVGNTGTGSSMVLINPNGTSCIDTVGCIFATRGGTTATFGRFNIGGSNSISYGAGVCGASAATTAGTWTQCTNAPVNIGAGGSLAFNGSDSIYVLMGASTSVYKYTLSTDGWGAPLSPVDNAIAAGGTLAYYPTGSGCTAVGGCLFATRGGSTHYYKGVIAANGSVTWSYVANTPIAFGDGASVRRVGNVLYYERGNYGEELYTYSPQTNLWTRMADAPSYFYQGSEQGFGYNTDNNFLYSFRGAGESSLYAYDLTNDNWKRGPALPNFYTASGFSAGTIVYDGSSGLAYVARGNGYSDFWSYNTSTGIWKQLADVPHTVTTGASAVYVNHATDAYDGIYLAVGAEGLNDNITYFYRYSIASDSWVQLSYKTAAANIGELAAGADLVFNGTDNIYTAQGGTTAFYSYDITDNQWTNLTGANQTLWAANGSGSCAVKINVSGTDYIYLARANSQANVYRFNLGTLQWDAAATVENAPGVLVAGDACSLDGQGNILFPQGTTNTNMYVLDPDGNVSGGNNGDWSTRTVLQTYSNGALVQGPANTILGFRGGSTSAMDRYVVSQAGVSGFEQSGTWTSEIIDFNSGNAIGVYNYAGLDITMTDATDTYETVETRTCSDAGCAADANDSHWGEWTAVSNQRTISGVDYYSVVSAVARYGQVRVRLTSDQVLTPTIHSLNWNYYVDSTDPNNPASVIGYTGSDKVTGVTSGQWANDLTPYFEWTSTDVGTGIGIEGYYVYFGTDITKDPITDASDPTNLAYRSGTNYYTATGLSSTGSWNAATQSASALTDGTYYLRIKTKDRNGNISDAAYNGFTFMVDNSDPNNITDLSVATYMLPTDTFSFSWTEPADVGPAGIDQYCYHRGALADTCVNREDICSGGSCTVTNIAHYQTRVNTFYVRAVDNAGNDTAASPTYASTGYFYTGGPPTAPQSVTVSPDSMTDTNAFAVQWTLPATCFGQTPCQAGDILRYCYTFNDNLPSAGTCGTNYSGSPTPSPDGGWTTDTQTAGRQLTTFSAALRQGSNTIHVVAMDAVGNINYDNYTSDSYTFTSNAPGIPAGLSATDSSDRAANRYSITLTWDEPDDVGSGVEGYRVYRCTADCEDPDVDDEPPVHYTLLATVTTLGYLDTSLNNALTYTYFIRATGTGATKSGNSALVSMRPEGKFKAAPAMSGNPTATARIRSAEITWLTQDDVDRNGNPIPHPASSYVQYGQTSGYGEGEPGTSDLVNEHSVTLTNLSPNTTYHYRLKWVDVDGNQGLSGDYTFITLGAPSAPTAVTATPTSGTTNSFGFSWTAPADEGVTVASYKYSINSTPTAENTTTTTAISVPAFAAATRQGTNTFYVVAVDDGGNVNYNNYGSADFIAYTTPPSPPRNITITDSSDRDAKRYSITITWDASTVATAGRLMAQAASDSTIYYTIYRSTDSVNFSEIATITSTGYLDTGLDSSQTYYYKVTAQDKAQATSDSTKIVDKKPEGRFTQPPAITEAPEAIPDSYSAEIHWETERVASSFVDFGTAGNDLSKEQGTADMVTQHNVKVTGLQAETTYYFQIKSIDVDENAATSTIASFTTLEAPRVLNVQISDVRLYDGIISWQTNKESTAVINYGTTANYGQSYTDTSGSYALTHTVKLEGLKDSQTYHLRIAGQDRNGNPIQSDDYTFSTLTFPKITEITTVNKSQGQTEVSWKTNVPTTSSVEYYADGIAPKTQGNTAMVTDHVILLYGLEDATLYKFKARGSDEFGYEAVSTEQEFTTMQDTTAPQVYGVKSESNTIGSGEEAKIQIVVNWKSDEPATSQVEFGVGLSSTEFTDQTDENAELVMDHLTVISELTPAKTYHFRVVSRDKAGNITKSGSYTVLTSRKRESFLQLIISNLEETFSWLGNIGAITK